MLIKSLDAQSSRAWHTLYCGLFRTYGASLRPRTNTSSKMGVCV